MRLRKALCTVLSALFMLTFCTVTVSAADETKTYNLKECGFSLEVPADFMVLWTDMNENDEAIKYFGFNSKDMLVSDYLNEYGFILDAYDKAASEGDSGYNIHVSTFDTTATSVNDDVMKTDFVTSYENLYQVKIGDDASYSVTEINGVSYLNAQYVATKNGFTLTGNHYLMLLNDGKAIDICAISRQRDKQDEYADKVDAYISAVMNSVKFGDEAEATDLTGSQSAGNTDGRTTYTLDNGISFSLDSDWSTVWNEMPEDSPVIQKFGFADKNEAINEVLKKNNLQFYGNKNNDIYSFYIVVFDIGKPMPNLTGSDDRSKETMKNEVIKTIKSNAKDPDSFKLHEFEIVEINGMEYEHFVFDITLPDDILLQGDYYITIIDGASNGFYAEAPGPENPETSLQDLSEYMSAIMSTITFGNAVPESVPASDSSSDLDSAPDATEEKAEMTLSEKITSFDFPMWIIVLVLAIVLFVGSSLSKKGEWQEEPFSLDKSKCIQGFCAVAIILHHLAQKFAPAGDIGALGLFTDIGVVFVGIFFFFSGYGLFKSLKTKEGYLKGFFKKRLPAILVPFYVCILVFIAHNYITGEKFGLGYLISVLTGWGLINSHMWYIVEIAILYVIFFFVFRFIKKENAALTVMGVLTAALTVGSLLLGHGENFSCRYWFMGEWWYNTTLVFFVGMLIAKNEKVLADFAKKTYKILLPVCIIITGVLGYFTRNALIKYSYWAEGPDYMGYKEKFICLGFQLPMVAFAVITLLLIMMKIKFTNPVLKFLGSISLELYLVHNLFLEGLGNNKIAYITGPALYVVLTVLLSIALATIVSGADKYIIALIAKRKTASNIESRKIHSIDCMRFIMAFLVVCIHIPFASAAGNVAMSFGKTAVPFFLVVCGYFLYREDNNEFFARLKKQTKKILLLTIGANILFGAFAALQLYMRCGNLIAFSSNFTPQTIKDFLLYNMSPFAGHLWYLGSLLYALVMLMILCKTKLHKYVMFASPLLLGVYIALSWFGNAEYYVYRNALFVTLPYVMMGCIIRRYEDKLMKIKAPVLWAMAAVLCATTIVELNVYKRGAGVPFFSAEILVYVIVLLLLKYRDFGKDTLLEKLGSKCSLFIYIVHMIPILIICNTCSQSSGFIMFYGPVTVFIITTLVAVLFKIKHFLPEKPSKDQTLIDSSDKVLEKVN